jgi:predicted phage terminase large subunit-like protein
MTPKRYHALLRTDLYAFVQRAFRVLNPGVEFLPNWHIRVIVDALERCRTGETKRLIINVPPRSLKSHCAVVSFVAFLLGHDPSAQVICASYAQSLAEKHSLDCRAVMASDFYQQTFNTRLSKDKNTSSEFVTEQRGFRYATSVGGTLTGRGANYLIIDDPHKPEDALSDVGRKSANDWFDHTLRSRLNSQEHGCIILIMQRLHEDDMAGHLIEEGGWESLSFPAIAEEDEAFIVKGWQGEELVGRKAGAALHPVRQSLESLAKLRANIGEYNFAGQYQQRPSPLGGGMVKLEWFKTYTPGELPAAFDMVFQSWDTANKATELSDYSVCTTWGVKKNDLFLLDVHRARLEYPALKRMIHSLAQFYKPKSIVIEDKSSGISLIQELRAEGIHEVRKYQPLFDKILRMHTASGAIEGGLVYLPHKADWLEIFRHEVSSFPKGRHDDQVDSMSQALDWFKTGRWARGQGLMEWMERKIKEDEAA